MKVAWACNNIAVESLACILPFIYIFWRNVQVEIGQHTLIFLLKLGTGKEERSPYKTAEFSAVVSIFCSMDAYKVSNLFHIDYHW